MGDLRERDLLKDLGVDGRIILTWIFKNWDGDAWTGLILARIWTDGGRLYAVMNFGIHKMRGLLD
jgi:hypothetical protein